MMRRQLLVFLLVGGLTVVIDFLCYRGLMWSVALAPERAKAVGFIAGTVFSYFANRAWTFGRQPHVPGSAWRFALLYAFSLGANVAVNALALLLLADIGYALQLAFLLATGVSTCLNFAGMKLFVFKFSRPTESL